jgi:hypothetical protein
MTGTPFGDFDVERKRPAERRFVAGAVGEKTQAIRQDLIRRVAGCSRAKGISVMPKYNRIYTFRGSIFAKNIPNMPLSWNGSGPRGPLPLITGSAAGHQADFK